MRVEGLIHSISQDALEVFVEGEKHRYRMERSILAMHVIDLYSVGMVVDIESNNSVLRRIRPHQEGAQ